MTLALGNMGDHEARGQEGRNEFHRQEFPNRILNSQMIRILGTAFAALVGLAFGSFLNVCLSRWPEGESVVKPRSHCRNCDHILAWWENIPLLSWVILRGRCRKCRAPISWRYPLVEITVGLLWAISAWRLTAELLDAQLPVSLVYYDFARMISSFILFWLLVALAALDVENLWLPNFLTIPGVLIGLAVCVANEIFGYHFDTGIRPFHVLCARALSVLAAAGLILLIRWIYWLIRRREGIGLGDAKLMAMLAAWLGLPGALLAFSLGVVLGSITALVLLVIPPTGSIEIGWTAQKLPLGTFLCIGGVISALWGQPILAAYLHWAGF
jgi:leader peptidase (prepilin peptidase)/N-methyltransferase